METKAVSFMEAQRLMEGRAEETLDYYRRRLFNGALTLRITKNWYVDDDGKFVPLTVTASSKPRILELVEDMGIFPGGVPKETRFSWCNCVRNVDKDHGQYYARICPPWESEAVLLEYPESAEIDIERGEDELFSFFDEGHYTIALPLGFKKWHYDPNIDNPGDCARDTMKAWIVSRADLYRKTFTSFWDTEVESAK